MSCHDRSDHVELSWGTNQRATTAKRQSPLTWTNTARGNWADRLRDLQTGTESIDVKMAEFWHRFHYNTRVHLVADEISRELLSAIVLLLHYSRLLFWINVNVNVAKIHLHLLNAPSFHKHFHYTRFANAVKYVAAKNRWPMFKFSPRKLISCFHFHLLLQSNHVTRAVTL